nr:hypothetical protein [Human alphaherpesvirus 2]QBH78353.1 hypothetical protein [Human alphaherpesvirus 2]QBH82899.1 hypothetical protein [Human alphaherpesvirus 2]
MVLHRRNSSQTGATFRVGCRATSSSSPAALIVGMTPVA